MLARLSYLKDIGSRIREYRGKKYGELHSGITLGIASLTAAGCLLHAWEEFPPVHRHVTLSHIIRLVSASDQPSHRHDGACPFLVLRPMICHQSNGQDILNLL